MERRLQNASGMSPSSAAVSYDSNVDTILTLPDTTRSLALAAACREAALAFLNESAHWGKAELAMWLMGPYAQLTQYVPSSSRPKTGEVTRPAPMLREIDARMVERVIKSAREEVFAVLAETSSEEGGASFAFTMLSSGFVARCEDSRGTQGWIPTTDARRLADRVLSLLAVDYLTRPADYESDLAICPHCGAVSFDSVARERGSCNQHGSGFFVPRPRHTIPYLPEGA